MPVIGSARVYVCGITPYDTTHLGHAATFVWTDLAARVLHLTGAHVDVCRNVTDVDDHLLAEASPKVSHGALWRPNRPIGSNAMRRTSASFARPSNREATTTSTTSLPLPSGSWRRDPPTNVTGRSSSTGNTCARPRVSTPVKQQFCLAKTQPAMTLQWTRPWRIHWTSSSGNVPPETSRHGRARGERGGLVGTPNVLPWRSLRSVRLWTSTAVEPTSDSRTTPTKRRWPKRSPGWLPLPALGCMWAR